MPKIPNWTRWDDHPFGEWVHDETGEAVSVGIASGTEWDPDDTPRRYHVLLWDGDGTTCRVDSRHTAKQAARNKARDIIRDNPDGGLYNP